MRRSILLILSLTLLFGSPFARAAKPVPKSAISAPFFLHDGDTVVFYGDSITEQQMYGRDIETFVLARYPQMHVRFINSGWSGDTVWGGGGGNIELRLKRDVLPYKPTVVTIFLGMNDGGYNTLDATRLQQYTDALNHIVDELQQNLPGVRLTLLTPSLFNYQAKERPANAAPPFNYNNPYPNYNQTLIRYGDQVRRIGATRHIPVVDLNAPMYAATLAGRKTDPHFALSGDGVHPNDVGHLIMAAAVLKTWHARPLRPGDLPWPLPAGARMAFQVSPLPGSLDQTGTPSAAQSQQYQQVLDLVQRRINQWHDFFKGGQGIAHRDDVPTQDELMRLTAENSQLDALRDQARGAAQAHQ